MLNDPARLVFDFREVDFAGIDPTALMSTLNANVLKFGAVRPGWSRLELDLASPHGVKHAGLSVDANSRNARLKVALVAVEQAEFDAATGTPRDPEWGKLMPSTLASIPTKEDKAITILLDPGHGGLIRALLRMVLTKQI
ncbi:hypothetical protein [Planktotalea sp.]|uniref:hypothetical protein n=1 Tax=Planktotalea sp. TaxID=2029877 RepID=UPI0025D9519C|nr:hypothetical protein [Planktotalea sp.]